MKERIKKILLKERKYRDPDFSATKLSEMLGIENYALSRIIKKEFGCSYSDIVLSARIKDAKKYLKNPRKDSMTVEEIGILVGFKNKASFFTAYRKYAGGTPEVYRRSLRKMKNED